MMRPDKRARGGAAEGDTSDEKPLTSAGKMEHKPFEEEGQEGDGEGGEGADKDTADIMEGLIREVEHRSGAKVAYTTAVKYSAAGGMGALELATEYVDDYSFAQQLIIQSVEDPALIFFDACFATLAKL